MHTHTHTQTNNYFTQKANYSCFKLALFKIKILCKLSLSVIRCTFKTGISFNFHQMCFIKLSGSQSGIKMIDLIIPAAVRKGYKRCATCRILTCDSLLAWAPSLGLQTRRNDTVPCSNPPPKKVLCISYMHEIPRSPNY